ncbi:MAG TPA: hydrogenase maturation protease, partial [Kiloniellaceae bacterium]|nr:hydrogenase maturation protease [Kiloniellaceae bacterium]
MTERPNLIIGIGDRMRGDDGAGPVVIDSLRKNPLVSGVELQEQWGEGTALMAAWEGRSMVIVVDAVAPAGSPGAIHRFDGHMTPPPRGLFHYSAHRFGLAEAVALAR